MAVIGQVLTAPDVGWKRYEETDASITYSAGWVAYADGGDSFGREVYGANVSAKFNFTGPKLRLATDCNPSCDSDAFVKIDNVDYKLNFAAFSAKQCLIFDKSDFADGEHSVVIYNTNPSKYITMDVIDIDANGTLKPYNANPALYLIKTPDGHYWSHKSGAWIDLGIPADQAALLTLFKANGESNCPTQFKQLGNSVKICKWEVSTSAPLSATTVTAVPIWQFIHANGDVDLSGYGNVDWVRFNDGTTSFEAGGGKIRLLASRDQGKTWWSWDGSNFVQVVDTTKDGTFSVSRFIPNAAAMARIMSQGMSKAIFDSAPWQSWTLDVGFSKIRFGYGLSIAASSDVALADNLKIQYDGFGDWLLCQNKVDYKLRATPNQFEVEVLAPLNGARVKVNYG